MEHAMRKVAMVVLLSTSITSTAYAQRTTDAEMGRKLALAQQYVDLTGREKRIEAAFANQLRLGFDGCTDDVCREALRQAVEVAVSKSAREHERATVALFASRLSEDELRAAISFAQSPQVKAIAVAENQMSSDLETIARTLATSGFQSVRDSFCVAHSDACARAFAKSAGKTASRQ